MGNLENTKPFYKQFRKIYTKDVNISNRVGHTGLNGLLADVAKYCFMGEPSIPPQKVRHILGNLVQPEHALV